jgi:hypothetical protein
MTESCSSCKFYKQTFALKNKQGVCKFMPPTPLVMIHMSSEGVSSEITKCSPGMEVDDWCGQYRQKLVLQ